MHEYTYLKRIELPVTKLKIGMYVGKLDKPWEESSFLFQGFPIDNENQIKALQRECLHVFVDFKTQEEFDSYLVNNEFDLASEKADEGDIALVEELPKAIKVFRDSSKIVKVLMRQVMQGATFDLNKISDCVSNAIESIEQLPEAILLAINEKNKIHYTSEHSLRVSVIAICFGSHLNMSHEQLRLLGLSGMLHDIGKSLIPAKILDKPGKLDVSEAKVLKNHPKESFRILSQIEGLSEVVKEVALSHHEREDGNGYPRRIPKDRVSRYAKIISMIDVYDAVVSDRAYSQARSATYAFKLLNDGKNKKFNPELVEDFIEWIGVSPVGTLVEMTTGEVGIVIKNNPLKKLKPRVMLVTDENKKTGYNKIVDLSKIAMHSNGQPYRIKSTLASRSYGINTQHYLDRKMFDVPAWCKSANENEDSPFSNFL